MIVYKIEFFKICFELNSFLAVSLLIFDFLYIKTTINFDFIILYLFVPKRAFLLLEKFP